MSAAAMLLLARPVSGGPVNTVLPSISGTTNVGETSTGTPGTSTGDPVLTHQWRRDGVDISGETGLTYLQVDADFGTMIDWLEIPDGDTTSTVAATAVGPVDFAYLLRVEFDTDDAAPLTSPYVGETGSLT